MTNKLALMAIPVLAAVLIGASFANPAFAVKNEKIADSNTVTVIGPIPFNLEICGINPTTSTATLHVVVKAWTNGKTILHTDQETIFTDPANGDALVAIGTQVQNVISNPDEGFPLVVQNSNVIECADGSTHQDVQCGFTIDENGAVHDHFCTV